MKFIVQMSISEGIRAKVANAARVLGFAEPSNVINRLSAMVKDSKIMTPAITTKTSKSITAQRSMLSAVTGAKTCLWSSIAPITS